MKIPFDIKYRPEIESGKYKVQTTDGRDVRIICWDKHYGGRIELVALVPTSEGNTEICQLYNTDGTLISSTWNEKFKLVLITDEPELTEFEQRIEMHLAYAERGMHDSNDIQDIKDTAKELLDLAKKELCGGCTKGIDEYWRGRKEAIDESSRGYRYEGPYMPPYYPCYNGGVCTNPSHDCINCPCNQVTIGINTQTSHTDENVKSK